jgi:hypothetical protein
MGRRTGGGRRTWLEGRGACQLTGKFRSRKKSHPESEVILVLKTMGSFRGPISKLDSEQFRNDYLVHFLDHDSPAIRKAVRPPPSHKF